MFKQITQMVTYNLISGTEFFRGLGSLRGEGGRERVKARIPQDPPFPGCRSGWAAGSELPRRRKIDFETNVLASMQRRNMAGGGRGGKEQAGRERESAWE